MANIYHRGNQNQLIEGQTTQWPKKNNRERPTQHNTET